MGRVIFTIAVMLALAYALTVTSAMGHVEGWVNEVQKWSSDE